MSKYKITALTSLGAALEYYDFVIYAMLAKYLSTIFFPNEEPLVATLNTFAVFAIGYLVRPLGGMIFGSRSDRLGRKKNFIITLLLMASSTLAIGLLPTYQHIGISACLLLIALRAIQGLAYGAEMPGAITFLTEHCPSKRRGLHCGLMFLSVGLGTFLASSLVTILTSYLTSAQMHSFGWRIPFLFGGVLAVVGAILRRAIEESPLFERSQPLRTPLRVLIQQHSQSLFIGTGITLFAACFILFFLYIPTYLHQIFHYPLPKVYQATTISLMWSALLLPLFGWLSDHLGRSKQLMIGSLAMVIGGYSLFHIASLQTTTALYAFTLLYQTLVAWLAACYPSMLAELFPTQVRYSGVAICYNTAYVVAGLTPVAASYLLARTHNPMTVSVMLSAIAVISVIAVWFHVDRTGEVLGV